MAYEKYVAESPAAQFLRSINVELDAEYVDRIAHYQPTRKNIVLTEALLGLGQDRSFVVVAPYGSGKSLTAAYSLHLIENRATSREVLKRIEDQTRDIDEGLVKFSKWRRQSETKGLVVVLTGEQKHLGSALYEAVLISMSRCGLGKQARPFRTRADTMRKDIKSTLQLLEEKLTGAGYDRMSIVWDEFGRHLEGLIADGRSQDLMQVQQLSELVTRATTVPTTIALLQHQTMLHYTSGLPQAARAEWKKVEGRFSQIQFVDDSYEISRLIAQNVASKGPRPAVTRADAKDIARAISDTGWFRECSKTEITNLVFEAAPLEPAALYLLPRISARVAQNERTLFSFLFSADFTRPVGPPELYDYFSGEMQVDVAAGGTHRRWIETESALSKVAGDNAAERILKTACLMALGLGGERNAVGKEELRLAAAGFNIGDPVYEETIDSLISKNLLLHRRNTDQISVWHGTDVDLRGRLDEEKARYRPTFDLIDFLDHEAPAPMWRPTEHNSRTGVRRYLEGQYLHLTDLRARLSIGESSVGLKDGIDGEALFVLSDTKEEVDAATELASDPNIPRRTFLAIPSSCTDLNDAALETYALIQMENDPKLAASDPLAQTELGQLLDDARINLRRLIDRHTVPSKQGPIWWINGKPHKPASPKALRVLLSKVMDREFSKAPRIHNEAIVRHQPTSVMVNARKKLELAILERSGIERLGIEGNFPDASMFQTVLLHTGLYREDSDGRWRWARHDEIEGTALAEVWSRFERLMTEPDVGPKGLSNLISELQCPPYGVRRGLFPVFLAAALRAFPAPRSIAHNGEYIRDILPSVIEDICRNPDEFELTVLRLGEVEIEYLEEVYHLLTGESPTSTEDLIRQCYDALQVWKASLPESALRTRKLSRRTLTFRKLITRVDDPVDLLLRRLPHDLAKENSPSTDTIAAIEAAISELASYSLQYLSYAGAQVRQALSLDPGTGDAHLQAQCLGWLGWLPPDISEHLKGPAERGLLTRMRIPYDTEDLLIESLADHVTGQPIRRWDDATAGDFAREFRALVNQVEEQSIAIVEKDPDNSSRESIRHLYRRRIESVLENLRRAGGDEIADDILRDLSIGRGKSK